MIFYMHTPDHDFMVGADLVPNIGELFLFTHSPECYPTTEEGRLGLFKIEQVVHHVASAPGSQRVDVYARKIGDPGKSRALSYQNLTDVVYQDDLKRLHA